MQDRAAWILKSPKVAGWLRSSGSRVLIINGGESKHSKRSATPLFTAMLVRALEANRPGVVILWFCGQNIDDSVQRMLRNLAGQLIDQSSTDIDLPSPSNLPRTCHTEGSARLLCSCLIAQLEKTPVYCILDAVSFYEDQHRSGDLCYVFKLVVSVVKRHQTRHGYGLKVLVTSPTRVLGISETISATNATVLDVPYEVAGSMYGLRNMDIFQSTQASLLGSS